MFAKVKARLSLNAQRYWLIKDVDYKLNQWRDMNDRRYLDEAIEMLRSAE